MSTVIQSVARSDFDCDKLLRYFKHDEFPHRDENYLQTISAMVLAFCNTDIVGIVGWKATVESDGCRWGNITDVHVVCGFRKQGLATSMMQRAMSDMQSENIYRFLLRVNIHNSPAIRLYKSQGFGISHVLPMYYTSWDTSLDFDSDQDDAYLMKLIL